MAATAISVAFGAFIAFIAIMPSLAQRQTRTVTRFDPADFSSRETESVIHMLDLLQSDTRPPALVDERGNRLDLPRRIFELLVNVASAIQNREAISLVPESQELTTQATANILGVSRPYLIKLLESGKIPFHKVGAHRRIRMKDIIVFQQTRDLERRRALDELARKTQQAGLY